MMAVMWSGVSRVAFIVSRTRIIVGGRGIGDEINLVAELMTIELS